MDLDKAFDDLQRAVNATPEAVKEARRRRDLFLDALGAEEDVVETVPSGSLARGSQKDPIHDVDVIIAYDAVEHPGWGVPGASASDALDHVQERVHALLGVSEGSFAKEVRLAKTRNHSVKCWLDDPEEDDAFTVDVTPALRQQGERLLIPEKQSSAWVSTAPELLIRLVAARHSSWNRFVPLVRDLKRWGADRQTEMKSLLLEVLALHHLPEGERPESLARFFTAGATAVLEPVEDPAGLCGEIQPDLDRLAAAQEFMNAAESAWRAVEAEARGDTDHAACLWRTIFDDIFPEPEGGCGDGGTGGAAGAAVAAITIPRPRRPVRDAPQG